MDNKLNLLVAFPYFSNSILETLKTFNPNSYRLIIDSGAFTAHNSGHEVTLDQYCNFLTPILKEPISIDGYVQLDVIFNEAETIKNYQEMLKRGFNPCPIFTRGSDERYFHELCEQEKYVFVGGVQRGLKNRNFAKWILEHSAKYKVHLLAFVKPDFINHYRPYSVDSSSWSNSSRFGMISYFRNGRINSIPKQKFIKGLPSDFLESVERLGFSRDVLSSLRFNDSWSSFEYCGDPDVDSTKPIKGLAQFITMCSWIYYTIQAQNVVRTKIYMAIAQNMHLVVLKAAYELMTKRGVI